MLVLVGPQGAMKSTALRVLAGGDDHDSFFCDAEFLRTEKTKEVIENLSGAWIVECAELSGLKKKDAETLKHIITRQEDRARLSFERNAVTIRRRFLLAGTTNEARFLHDSTGNRRFWPFEVGTVLLDKLKADRDQLWAEALARYRSGADRLYLAGEALEGAVQAQAGREVLELGYIEVLEGLVPDGEYECKPVVKNETVYDTLGIPPERRRGGVAVGVMKAMAAAGWEPLPGSVRFGGKKQRLYVWTKSDEQPPDRVF